MSGSAIYTFDYSVWSALFPELVSSISSPQATLYFGVAETMVDNMPCSIIPLASPCDPSLTPNSIRGTILNLTTAHIAALFGSINGQPPNPLVGRISDATEGSVSVSVDFASTQSAAWWNQTKYGSLAWAAMAPYRMALYAVPPQIPRVAQSYPFFLRGGFSGRVGWRP